ncbi:MAG: alpha-L-fucosidase [Akkermansiaceae bacterium]|nr:alpha-L-fucosidase [Akkermansiaceae bacterium]
MMKVTTPRSTPRSTAQKKTPLISMLTPHKGIYKMFSILLLLVGQSGIAQGEKADAKTRHDRLEEMIIDESLEAYNERMKWFAEAKFGMFIHFGLYSQLGGEWKGEEVQYLYAEWIQNKADIPKEEYAELLKTFNPTKFDAEFIVTTAKEAGMKYLVITAKHHEGFCLWDSEYTEYDVASTPFKGRDILDELNKACQKHGLKFGLYYSILDWHHPAQKRKRHYSLIKKGRKQEYLDYQKNQVLELIEKYDPALLWFDGDWCEWWSKDEKAGIDLYNAIRKASPKVIANNRIGARFWFELDYITVEQGKFDDAQPHHWESCYTIGESWGYKKGDKPKTSPGRYFRKLNEINSNGGNYLLNIGPDGDGEVPAWSVDFIRAMGKMYEAKPPTKNIPEIEAVPGIR